MLRPKPGFQCFVLVVSQWLTDQVHEVTWLSAASTKQYIVSSEVILRRVNCAMACKGWEVQKVGNLRETAYSSAIKYVSGFRVTIVACCTFLLKQTDM